MQTYAPARGAGFKNLAKRFRAKKGKAKANAKTSDKAKPGIAERMASMKAAGPG